MNDIISLWISIEAFIRIFGWIILGILLFLIIGYWSYAIISEKLKKNKKHKNSKEEN